MCICKTSMIQLRIQIRRLVTFEDELHEAVEAGVNSYSGQKVWRLKNSILYAIAVASTVG